jgi:hypothetical protein
VHSDKLVWIFHDVDCTAQSDVWLARVPSHSNPADAPSRGDFDTNVRLFNCTTVNSPSINVAAGKHPWETMATTVG